MAPDQGATDALPVTRTAPHRSLHGGPRPALALPCPSQLPLTAESVLIQ